MLEQKEIYLADERIVIQQLPTTKAIAAAIEIMQLIGGMAEGVGAMPADNLMEIPISPGKIVDGLIKRLNKEQTPMMLRRLVADSMVKPEYTETWFETRFAGRFDDLYKLIEAIISLNNYADVLKKRVQEPFKALFSPKPPVSIPS